MLKGRYFVFDVRRADGALVKLWVDGAFETLRVIDRPTFSKLQAIWKSRSVLLPAVVLPVGAVLFYFYITNSLSPETLIYVLFGAVLVDLTSRAMLAWHERRTIGGLSPRPIPPEQGEAMRLAAKAGDIETIRAAATTVIRDQADR